MAAALAFYTAFSLAPLLVVAVAVASIFYGQWAIEGRLFSELQFLIGREAALAAQTVLANATRAGEAHTVGWLSLLATWLGATVTFAELNRSLNTLWRASPRGSFLATLIRVRLLSFGLSLGTGVLLVLLVLSDAALLYAVDQAFASGMLGSILGASQQLLSFAVLCCAFAVLLKVLPDAPVAWRDAFVGAGVSAVLFAVGKHLFAIYLAHSGNATVFGAASSLAVLMMWLLFSAQTFLVGATLAAVLHRERQLSLLNQS